MKMNITKNNKGLKRKPLIAIISLLPLLTGCATYSSGFTCGDAKGVACTPMEKVDQLISSGEIDAVLAKKKRCRGRSCTTEQKRDVLRNALINKNN